MPDFQFRIATRGDMPRVFELIAELAEFEEMSDQVTGSLDDLSRTLCGPAPVANCIVVEGEGGVIVAYAIWFQTYSTFRMKPGMWLEDLYVTPSSRRLGIGRGLLDHLAALAGSRGYARFEWSVLDWNENAQRLYRDFGAEILPQWRICRVEDLESRVTPS